MKRLEVLNEYYTDLDYNINKDEALEKISDLSKTVRFHNSINISDRLEVLANVIQDNISFFKSVCAHVDMIDTIVGYLNHYAAYIKYFKDNSFEIIQATIFPLVLTLFRICDEFEIKAFLLLPIFTDSLWPENTYSVVIAGLSLIDLEGKMIILEDSDLYAVVNYLIITDKFPLHMIWVQEQVKEKFVWLMKRHYSDITACEEMLLIIDTFQSLKDIQLHVYHEPTISVVSIWSEDIVAAKNLARSLNSHIILINSYMHFSGTAVLFPYEEMCEYTKKQGTIIDIRKQISESDSTDTEHSVNVVHLSHIAEINFNLICDLFYDGTWQKPVKGMYWKHNDYLWANATNDDIIRCYESAEEGFKTWSIKSVKTRIQILSKLASMLKLNGKLVLAAIVTRWLKFPYLFCIEGYLSRNAEVERTIARVPLGVIILREENESVLFFRLMQTLIAGNSVIVMFGANFCDLSPYCDMFSTCGIPPGVINLLSHEDTDMLGYKLCSQVKYTDYADAIFSKGNSKETYIKPYKNLTVEKNIILYLK